MNNMCVHDLYKEDCYSFFHELSSSRGGLTLVVRKSSVAKKMEAGIATDDFIATKTKHSREEDNA